MIIVPGKLIFLETPRTASRAVAEAFIKHVPNTERTNCRHIPPEDVPRETGLPIYTFTRHPTRLLFSWYKYGVQQKAPWVFVKAGTRVMTFAEFIIAPFRPLPHMEPDRLNIYHSVANYFWPLEWGIEQFFLVVLKLSIKAETVGEIRENKQFTLMETRLIDHKYALDEEIYRGSATSSEHLKLLR